MKRRARAFINLTAGSIALVLGPSACTDVLTERVSDCVEVYQGTGAVRRQGFTEKACEERCAMITGVIDCYWDEDSAL
jgi:hypothetical protein